MRDHLLALDQGTTSSRALLLGPEGGVVAMAQAEFGQAFPRPGWVEHDPDEIWATQSGVAAEVLARAGIGAERVAAIGITNQRETVVVWDRRTGRPVHNAIVWQDRRTAGACDALRATGLEELVRERTGLVIDPYFSGTKLAWVLDHVEGARARAERGELAFGTVDTWLLWRLTGGAVHATDETNASRTMLFDIHRRDWDEELLGHLRVPRAVLPRVCGSSEAYGEAVGGLAGVPVAGIAGDQQSALFGQMCHEPGMAKATYGTGCFMLMNTGEAPVASPSRLLATVAWRQGGRTAYALEGSVFVAGAVVQWLRDGLKVIRSAGEVEALAGSVPDTGDVFLVPAFAGLGAPHWDPYARGTIVGLTRGTTDAHLARAALEGIAFQAVDILRAMEADSGIRLRELRVDGGAARNDLLMQVQADLLGIPVVRPAETECTALGSAYLAGLAVGRFGSLEEVRALWRPGRVFEPAMAAERREALHARWRRALEHARGWVEAGG